MLSQGLVAVIAAIPQHSLNSREGGVQQGCKQGAELYLSVNVMFYPPAIDGKNIRQIK
jgi:hypothetical protein